MPLCAFLTLDDPATHGVVDDNLAYEPLRNLGWRVEAVPWRRSQVAWKKYDAVVIRSTWDYIEAPEAFLGVLETIQCSNVPLFNGFDLVRWNLQKTYLRDLANRGVPVVPTVWRDRLSPGELPSLLKEVGAAEAVIKPIIGAGASGTYRLNALSLQTQTLAIEDYYRDRGLMIQPFLNAVTTEGEFSLVYFNGVHSHTTVKQPKAGDFRVQTSHGGSICSTLADETLIAAGGTVLSALSDPPLYARADFVRANDGNGFWLVELELIEPSLYLHTAQHAPERFAQAFHERTR